MSLSRIIVTLQPTRDAMQVKLDKALEDLPEGLVAVPFACEPPSANTWAAAEGVKLHGSAICHALAQHPAIKQVLQKLAMAPPTQITPIYFHLQSTDAEQLYWEALYDEDQGVFLALDRRWPIGRIADALTTQQGAPFLKFEGRLRMAAVLSALDISAVPEWESLRSAVNEARQQGLAVDLLLLVGEEELHDSIQASIDAGALPDTRVKLLESTGDKLERAIEEFRPHLLHFFCHGAVDHGISRLELASALDWASVSDRSSLVVTVDQLIALPSLRQAWLVVLNCCQGGAATEQLHSMAHQLVARGVPAAVGMLEPIASLDANRFSAGFYPALFGELKRAVDAAGAAPSPVEWTIPLRAARIQLHGANDPRTQRNWTLPVLYARPELFQIVSAGNGGQAGGAGGGLAALQAMLRRAQEVADFLRTLPPSTPQAARVRALALLDEAPAVPPELRPDLFGNFT